MKKSLFLALGVAGLLPFSFARAVPIPPPVKLELVSSTTGLPSETVTPNTVFTLDIAVQDVSSTQALASFNITLGALPPGLTFDGFSNLISNFGPNAAPDGALSSSATANSPASDVTIGATQTDLLQATFTATNTLALGPYTLDFIVTGPDQVLDNPTSNPITYQDISDTLTVTPEPGAVNLLLLGVAAVIGFSLRRRIARS